MEQLIHCPSCRSQLNLPTQLLGQPVQCPTCGHGFTAGADTAATYVSPAPAQSAERRFPDDERFPSAHDPGVPPPGMFPDQRVYLRRDLQPHRAELVLTLGIASIAVPFLGFCCQLAFLLGPAFGVTAWIMGNGDLEMMRTLQMDPVGERSTRAGRLCGIIGTVLSVLLLVGYVAFIIIIFVVLPQQGGANWP